jgi:hypothetical protein
MEVWKQSGMQSIVVVGGRKRETLTDALKCKQNTRYLVCKNTESCQWVALILGGLKVTSQSRNVHFKHKQKKKKLHPFLISTIKPQKRNSFNNSRSKTSIKKINNWRPAAGDWPPPNMVKILFLALPSPCKTLNCQILNANSERKESK